MKVKLARTAGFCFGVKRAVEMVLRTAGSTKGPVFTWGPLIHNPQTVDFLKQQGVDYVDNFSNIADESTVVIRSHGVPPDIRKRIKESGARICDATCPRVGRVQALIKNNANSGKQIIIVGNPEHAEVKGLKGYAPDNAIVINSIQQIAQLPELKDIVVIGQTTLKRELYMNLAEAVKERFPRTEIIDTLCDSTTQRQEEIKELSRDVDAIVVVGGKNSSNTGQLYKTAQATGLPSFWVETAEELNSKDFQGMTQVALTAGASTPHWIVARVIEKLEIIGEKHIPLWRKPRIKDFGYAFIQGNCLTGLSAAFLSIIPYIFAGSEINLFLCIAAGLFIFSMHTLYDLVDWQGLALMDPSKIRFFMYNSKALSIASALGLLLALVLSFISGIYPFIMILLAVIVAGTFGFFYQLGLGGFIIWRRIPYSKDLLHMAGWVFATGFLQLLVIPIDLAHAIYIILFILSIALIRAVILSISDLETDRVLERNSFSTKLGENRAWYLSMFLVIIALCSIIFGQLTGNINSNVFWQIVLCGYILCVEIYFFKFGIRRSTWVELAIDSGLILSEIIPLLQSII